MWYKNDFSNGTTLVQVHDLSNPEDYEPVTLPYIVEQTPRFIPGSDNQYAALARAEDDAIKRQNLILFSSNKNSFTGRIPNVKPFAVLTYGPDMVIFAEDLGTTGKPICFDLAVNKKFHK